MTVRNDRQARGIGGRGAASLSAVALLLAAATPALAEDIHTWVGPDGGNWSTDANWSVVHDPDGPKPPSAPGSPSNDDVRFNAASSSSIMDIDGLVIDDFLMSNGQHTVDLAGNTFLLNQMMISLNGGSGQHSLAINGAAGSKLVIHDDFWADGSSNSGHDDSIDMTIGENVAWEFGNAVGDGNIFRWGNNTGDSSGTSSALTVNGTLVMHTNDLLIAVDDARDSGGGPGSRSVMDLTNAGPGSEINVYGNLRIADGRRTAGQLLLGDGIDLNVGTQGFRANEVILGGSNGANDGISDFDTVLQMGNGEINIYATSFRLGDSREGETRLDASLASGGVIDISDEFILGKGRDEDVRHVASMVLADGIDLKVGDAGDFASLMKIGDGYGSRGGGNRMELIMGAGHVDIHVQNFQIGVHDGTYDRGLRAYVRFGQATGGQIVVGDTLTMGTGTFNARAELDLGVVDLSTQNLVMGSTSGDGTITLDGGVLHISGDANIVGNDDFDGSRIIVNIAGESSGLDLGALATLTLDENTSEASIVLNFGDPTTAGIYWGLRWAGDHVSELMALGSQLVINDNTTAGLLGGDIGIFYDAGTDATYVGAQSLIPEPAGLALLAAGGLLVLGRRRVASIGG